jgi:hypothetical protein
MSQICELFLLFGRQLVQKSGGQQESVLTQFFLFRLLAGSSSHLLVFRGRVRRQDVSCWECDDWF